DEFGGRVLIGEIYLPLEKLVVYYGRDLRGCHLPFNFSLLQIDWHARAIAKLIDEYERLLPPGGWPNWVLGNHDRPRIASRVGREQARIAAMLLLSLRGTPTIYYGDEIGMVQVPIPPERVRDPLERNIPGLGLGRDGARTPMQWDPTPNAGFSPVDPWLPLTEDFRSENVENARRDGTSIYNLHRRLIVARRAQPALSAGSYHPIAADGDLILYTREYGENRILVSLNLGADPASVSLSQRVKGRVLVSSLADRDGEAVDGEIELRPHEGLIIALGNAVNCYANRWRAPWRETEYQRHGIGAGESMFMTTRRTRRPSSWIGTRSPFQVGVLRMVAPEGGRTQAAEQTATAQKPMGRRFPEMACWAEQHRLNPVPTTPTFAAAERMATAELTVVGDRVSNPSPSSGESATNRALQGGRCWFGRGE
ncbi:MAG TPA: alpha-amylase family glycosyl hydrolase, partial [Stellaceae bacterium]|nr:alpha-amylase family glycosyl hydrolase [Stellaceae bacterium]